MKTLRHLLQTAFGRSTAQQPEAPVQAKPVDLEPKQPAPTSPLRHSTNYRDYPMAG